MKAVIFRKHGDESVLELADMPMPAVGARDVRVRVHAVALNHLDLWVRKGHPGLKLQLPHITGADVAGTVESVGAEVKDLQPGAEVLINPGISCGACEQCLAGRDSLCRDYAILGEDRHGGYAEYVSVPRQNVLPKPQKLTFAEAACLPLTFLTSWTMLMRRAQVRPGETVLVHAAGSGVGSAAVQIAKLAGATVIATAS
ncbi:MAG TPA: alcohol dehydrogenase catalytic domain-containing protein, partial [Myxococcaceae bacterium]